MEHIISANVLLYNTSYHNGIAEEIWLKHIHQAVAELKDSLSDALIRTHTYI